MKDDNDSTRYSPVDESINGNQEVLYKVELLKKKEDPKVADESIDDGFLEGVDDAFKVVVDAEEGPIERLSGAEDESLPSIESLDMSSGSLIKARSMT